MCYGVLCYLEPSIVFKAKVARHVRILIRHLQCDSYSYNVLESIMRKQTKNIVSAETLTILHMISSSTNSPPEEVSSE